MLNLGIVLLVFLTVSSPCFAFAPCPNKEDLYPCKCQGAKPNYTYIYCESNEEQLDLASIFSKVSKDARLVDAVYDGVVIKNKNILEIPENALGTLNLKKIEIGSECSSLRLIHSKAFLHQSETTENLVVYAKKVVIAPFPYSFHDLVNSFPKLRRLHYHSRIGTLDERTVASLNSLEQIYLAVDAIHGSPFLHMNKISDIGLEGGKLNHIPNHAFKINKSHVSSKKIFIYLHHNKLNGLSFENNVFIDASFANMSLQLDLKHNLIRYLNETVFLPFLSTETNSIEGLQENPLDCDDCRSAWICKSTTPDNVRKSIHYAKCFDGRELTDCSKNFVNCKSRFI